MPLQKALEVSVQNAQNPRETVFGLLISPPSAFAPVFSPPWGPQGCCLLPRGDSFSAANNVSSRTAEPFFPLPRVRSPGQSSPPRRSPAVKESGLKPPAAEGAFSTFVSFPLRFLFLTPGSILTQYRDKRCREERTNDGPTYKLPANCTESCPATFLSTFVHSIPASGSEGLDSQ